MNKQLPELFEDFISLGIKDIEASEKLLSDATKNDVKYASPAVNEVTILPPIASPPKIIC
jgi:hypothetical protein